MLQQQQRVPTCTHAPPPPTPHTQVRMQAEGKLPAGTPRQYPSAFKAYSIIARKEGIMGLWTGLGPNVARNAIINAAELASYDQVGVAEECIGVFCYCSFYVRV